MAQDPSKQGYWADHYRRWQTSGLSQRRYCQREGVSFSTFTYGCHRTRKAADSAPSTVDPKLTLVPVQVDTACCAGDLHLRSPAGWQVTLPETLATDLLILLLSQLP